MRTQISPSRDPKTAKKGQITLFAAGLVFTLLTFFAFSVNIAMLVHAKINLQSAADLAAYAGAATQARQMNNIGFLNYELVRNYKKFLFRYYALGSLALGPPTFPQSGGGLTTQRGGGQGYRVPTSRRSQQAGAQAFLTMGAPSICIDPSFLGTSPNRTDSSCRLADLPQVNAGYSPPPGEPIGQALAQTLKAMEAIRKKGCAGLGKMNVQLLYLWLINTDPDISTLEAELLAPSATPSEDADRKDILARIKTLKVAGAGLGLIPKAMLIQRRMETLKYYVNSPRRQNVTISDVNAWMTGRDWAQNERTIQAYLSAYNTLGDDLFPGSIQMDELIPGGSDSAEMLDLKYDKAEFTAFATDMDTGGCSENQANQDPNAPCGMCLTPLSIPSTLGPYVTAYKDPKKLVYYGVKLRAKAQLLFSIFGDVELEAYSAAMPFGSRIGPSINELSSLRFQTKFTSLPGPGPSTSGKIPSRCRAFTNDCPYDSLPNMSVLDPQEVKTVTGSSIGGYGSDGAVWAFSTPFMATNRSINSDALQQAIDLATSPTPYDLKRYLVPVDGLSRGGKPGDSFMRFFDSSKYYAIWAPLSKNSQESAQTLANEINIQLTNGLSQMTGSNSALASYLQVMVNPLKTGLATYLSALDKGQGEDGEGIRVYRIRDPFATIRDPAFSQTKSSLPAWFVTQDARIRNSWNGVKDANMRSENRVGYSVKLVALKDLASGSLRPSPSDSSFSNRMSAGSVGQQDTFDLNLEKIDH